jgi:hypothetical protein
LLPRKVASPRAAETGLAMRRHDAPLMRRVKLINKEKKMMKRLCVIFAAVCMFAMIAALAMPAAAQDEPKEKPPMYTYVGNWAIPRAQWAEMAKSEETDTGILQKAMADGTIVGYGTDMIIVHTADGETHDQWWSAMSMAGILNVLDKFYKSGSAIAPVLQSATKHWDNIFESRYYNWHSGSYKGAYTRLAEFKFKPDAPSDALGMASKHLFVPLMEKLLSDGTILEYEIDTASIHTEDPATFYVVFVTPTAAGLDKFEAALQEGYKMAPMSITAFVSMVDFTVHRDYLATSDGNYK